MASRVPSRRAPDVQCLATRVVDGEEVLAAGLDPLHGSAGEDGREGDEKILGIELAASAEASADIALDEMDLPFAEAEHRAEHGAVEVRDLGRSPHREVAAPGVEVGDESARLDRHSGLS